jgi:hypothetical protein
MNTTPSLVVLVDDVRTFADGRPHLRLIDSSEATVALKRLAAERTPVAELWLDYHLGRRDSIRPVLQALRDLDDAGRRLDIGRVIAHTSDAAGALEIAALCRQLNYDYERAASTRGVLVP